MTTVKLASYHTYLNSAEQILVFMDRDTITVKWASNKIGIRLGVFEMMLNKRYSLWTKL